MKSSLVADPVLLRTALLPVEVDLDVEVEVEVDEEVDVDVDVDVDAAPGVDVVLDVVVDAHGFGATSPRPRSSRRPRRMTKPRSARSSAMAWSVTRSRRRPRSCSPAISRLISS